MSSDMASESDPVADVSGCNGVPNGISIGVSEKVISNDKSSSSGSITDEEEFADALESPADEYICRLDEETQRRALQDLGEDPLTRMEQVRSLRHWLLQQKSVKANTDTSVLLLFLRAAKFNQEKARRKILGMLSLGRDRPAWFKDIDPTAEDIMAVYGDLYVIPLPKPDKEGCTVVLYRMGSFDPSGAKYTKNSIMKAFGALFINLMRLEENQVYGFVYVIDAADFNTRQQLFWTPNDLRTIARMWQKALPARFKRFHFIRMGITFDLILKLLVPFLSTKFKERIMIHGNDLNELRKHVPPEILPVEYLPEDYKGPNAGTMSQIVEDFKADLRSPVARDHIRTMTSSEFSFQKEKSQAPSRWTKIRHWVSFR